MPSFYKQTAENVAKGMNFGDAVFDSYWTTGAEVLSEMIFMNMGGKGARNMLQKMGINFKADKGAVGLVKNFFERAVFKAVPPEFIMPETSRLPKTLISPCFSKNSICFSNLWGKEISSAS